MIKKKNGFFTFIFSLIPGAGEMYMGFLKQGVSLMGVFIFLIFCAATLDLPALLFLMPIVWFYSFFHVHSLRGLSDEEFYAQEDDFLFHMDQLLPAGKKENKLYRRFFAVALLVFGAVLLCDNLSYLVRYMLPEDVSRYVNAVIYRLPQFAIGVLFVVVGIWLIRGKKKELEEQEQQEEQERQEEQV